MYASERKYSQEIGMQVSTYSSGYLAICVEGLRQNKSKVNFYGVVCLRPQKF